MSGFSYGRLGSSVSSGTPSTSERFVGEDVVSFSTSPTFNFSGGTRNNKSMTLTADVTDATFVATEKTEHTLRIIQDDVGGHDFVFPANVVGNPPPPDSTPGSSSIYRFYSDGTNLHF